MLIVLADIFILDTPDLDLDVQDYDTFEQIIDFDIDIEKVALTILATSEPL